MAKGITAVRLRTDQVKGLNEVLRKRNDEEETVSTLIRKAVDEFLKKEGVKRKK